MSASVFGIGRLLPWEPAAFGVMSSYANSTGRYDSEGVYRAFPAGYREAEWRTDLWGMARISEKWQAFGRVPWVVGFRTAEGAGDHTGQGLGDLQLGARWDTLLPGELHRWPALAFTATVTTPTSTRAEQAKDLLGADATGRGAWVMGLAVAIEKAWMPWFARVEGGLTVPLAFERSDTQESQRYGMGLQAGLSGGVELKPDKLVLALQLLADREAATLVNGVAQPDTTAVGGTAALALSWKFAFSWTLMGNVATDAPGTWLGARNRPERWAGTLGLRYGM
ncbi:MAG: hypothetical protein HY902_07385 [Deltaproteobacteria bacterium]|nr:hypothetical protein [Deltaproteobacteria bacterium]